MSCAGDVSQHARRARVPRPLKQRGLVRPREFEARGSPRQYLLRLTEGLIGRTARGLYRMQDAPAADLDALAEVGKRVPGATICLISALALCGLTAQIRIVFASR